MLYKKNKNYALMLIAVNTIILFLEFVYPWIIDSFALESSRAVFAPWTIITSMFLHSGFEHLLYNMFALGLFGIVLELLIGSRKFITGYLIAGIAASIATIFIYPNDVSLGASGAIYGIIGILTVLRPKMMIYVGVPLPMLFYAAAYVFFDMVGLFTGVNPDNIAYAAHISGFFAGVTLGFFWKETFREEKEINREISHEIDDEELDRWEDKYMR